MYPALDFLLLWTGLAHAGISLVCLALLGRKLPPILGIHPALKPLKFASSISAFLLTMAVLVPTLAASATVRTGLAMALSLAMVAEMSVIGGQALRGKRSHFNLESSLDRTLTFSMLLGIAVALVGMIAIALLATLQPLAGDARVTSPFMTAAWRASLWLFLFAAVSGFRMGGTGRHSIGGEDGGPGLPVTNWSTTHGDLRVSHFFAVHSLQIIPLAAIGFAWLPIAPSLRWSLLVLTIVTNAVLAGWTWLQALRSQPIRPPSAPTA